LSVPKWADVNHGSRDFTDDGIDLTYPFSTGQLHDLPQLGCFTRKRREHATFVTNLTDVCFKGHAFTEPRRQAPT
jgi:hypothetical protein